ncbi:DUF5996 family protein [Jannaschia sp. S6380]|uniref:DUF5996 family protein n=1 Tax=Jannaschia sp. S6380 TaxID=2926408 RepID=UPI001FF5FA9D|nr:DUF5996 family protein [Jannaschia sp. S6380]MCK0166771.1 DUF5996 family protein [Jannaschia sp. S6380]
MNAVAPWPDIPYDAWQETCGALHLWCQIVGKYRLRHAPWVNHSWHATLYVTSRGLTTGPIPDRQVPVTVSFDFCDHHLVVEAAGGQRSAFDLEAMSVAEFRARFGAAVEALGGDCDIHGRPNELPDPIPFAEDTATRPYDAEAVQRFHRALLCVQDVFERFRTGFHGKVSPVHLFWGSFDLAVTRFSGRRAPPHPGGMPYLPDIITREAYSHEVSSAGFWPGAGAGEAMFYSYAYPTPSGMSDRPVTPKAAVWNAELGEFLLPYDAVRTADDPAGTLLAFLQSTYDAAADTAGWDRPALERALGRRGTPPAEEGR